MNARKIELNLWVVLLHPGMVDDDGLWPIFIRVPVRFEFRYVSIILFVVSRIFRSFSGPLPRYGRAREFPRQFAFHITAGDFTNLFNRKSSLSSSMIAATISSFVIAPVLNSTVILTSTSNRVFF